MPTLNTSNLTGAALDWAVAKSAELDPAVIRSSIGLTPFVIIARDPMGMYCPSISWAQGGPIIEPIKGLLFKHWLECRPDSCCEAHIHNYEGDWVAFGPTPLIAAMRCFVASKLGPTVNVPQELMP